MKELVSVLANYDCVIGACGREQDIITTVQPRISQGSRDLPDYDVAQSSHRARGTNICYGVKEINKSYMIIL